LRKEVAKKIHKMTRKFDILECFRSLAIKDLQAASKPDLEVAVKADKSLLLWIVGTDISSNRASQIDKEVKKWAELLQSSETQVLADPNRIEICLNSWLDQCVAEVKRDPSR
jgi:hypothetical protein